MSLTAKIYNSVFKRSSSYVLIMLIGAYFLETGVDYTAETIFNRVNQGKLWHHIKDNYKKEEEAA